MQASPLLSIIAALTVPNPTLGQITADDVNGVWYARVDFVTEPLAEIHLVKQDGGWSVTGPNGDQTPAEPQPDGTFIASFGDLGTARFESPAEGEDAVVFWIQPPSPMLSQPHATPVRCQPDASGSWSGSATPLDDGTDFFLTIETNGNDTQIGFVEHTLNFGRFWISNGLKATPGGGLIFEGLEPAVTGTLSEDGAFVLDSEQIEPLAFRPIDAESAAGYEPGLPGPDAIAPRRRDDGWDTATPGEVGLDDSTIEALLNTLADPSRRTQTATRIHSVQIARGGTLAVDAYFFGRGPEDTHDTRSAGKSVGSLLVGAALGSESATLLSATLADLLKRSINTDASNATLGDLLSMRTGLWLDDSDPDCTAREDHVQSSDEQDWYKPALEAPRHHPRDTHFAYSSLSCNLAGAVVAEKTNRWIPALLEQKLLRPLNISSYHTNLMPSGDAYFGGGIRLRPRDFLKIGQLVLAGGRWNGQQVVPETWIEATTAPRSEVRPDFFYASGWWRRSYTIDGRHIETIQALGNGGQVVVAVPELDLTACFTAGNYNDGQASSQITEKLVPEYVIRAALEADVSHEESQNP